MGQRGPQKKLAVLKRLEGNPSKSRIDDSGIEAYGQPFTPEHLCDDARGCIEVIRLSMPENVYSALDSFHLAAFGTAWALHKQAALEISSPGFRWLVVNAAGSETPNPWFKILNEQARIMMSLGDRLGLDPKSRAALKLPGAKQQKQEFDGLIGRPLSLNSLNACAYQAE